MWSVAVCSVAVLGLLGAERLASQPGRWVAKPVAASCFLWAALSWGALSSIYGSLILLGLALSWCGDLLLIPSKRPNWFRVGIASFLLAHVAYALAFFVRGVNFPVLMPAGIFGVGLVWVVLRWIGPALSRDFVWPVRAYVTVISIMLALGVACSAAGNPWAVWVGGVGFALSDLSVARERFLAPGFVNAAWGLPLYFGSQLLLASTVS